MAALILPGKQRTGAMLRNTHALGLHTIALHIPYPAAAAALETS